MEPTIQIRKSLLLLIGFALFCTDISAQSIQNGNFEDWGIIGETVEPTNWSTSNYSDNAESPLSAHQAENACQGQYALKLTSTAPGFEGPGPGYAHQFIDLDEPVTSATITFSYAADTLLQGAFGRINLVAFDTSGENPELVGSESLQITQLTDGCLTGSLTVATSSPFHQVFVEARAEPHYTALGTEGLSVIRIDNMQLDLALSVFESNLSNQFELIPNPTNGLLQLQHDNLHITEILLMDLSGKVLRQVPVYNQSIDLSNLASGTYLLKVTAVEGVAVKKVVKK